MLISFCLTGFGCTLQQPKVETAPSLPPEPYIHTISYSGETLGIISYWYTGSIQNWREIAKNNPILDPRKLPLGTLILIPRGLLRTESPLPRKFVERVRPKTASAPRKNSRKPIGTAVTTKKMPDDGIAPEESEEVVENLDDAVMPTLEPTPDDSKMDAVLRSLLSEPSATKE